MDASALDISLTNLPDEQRRIAEVIGLDAYRKLVKAYGGMMIYIHKSDGFERATRNEDIRGRYRAGASYRQLASKYNLSEVSVRMIVAEDDKELRAAPIDGQLSMF